MNTWVHSRPGFFASLRMTAQQGFLLPSWTINAMIVTLSEAKGLLLYIFTLYLYNFVHYSSWLFLVRCHRIKNPVFAFNENGVW